MLNFLGHLSPFLEYAERCYGNWNTQHALHHHQQLGRQEGSQQIWHDDSHLMDIWQEESIHYQDSKSNEAVENEYHPKTLFCLPTPSFLSFNRHPVRFFPPMGGHLLTHCRWWTPPLHFIHHTKIIIRDFTLLATEWTAVIIWRQLTKKERIAFI